MTTEIGRWRAFTQDAAGTLSMFQRNEIGMAEAFGFFETNRAVLGDDDALQSIIDTVSEIDGFPHHYAELTGLLTEHLSRDDLIAWLKR